MATEPSAKPSVSALPTAPSRGDAPSTFRTLADAFLGAIGTFQTQMDTLTTWVSTTAQEVYDNAVEAASSASTATTQAGLANTAKENAETAEENAALSAVAAGDASPIDLASSNIGDLLQVVDVGGGTKGLAMSAQRLENSASFTGTTPSLDIAADQDHYGTLTGNTDFTFDVSGFGTVANNVIFFTLEVTQDAATQRSIIWPTSVEWPNDQPPTAQPIGEKWLYAFRSRDGGATWEGRIVGRAFA